ncbi:MAG: translation initiation factor IF-3 [Puniceicoccales bacterium]
MGRVPSSSRSRRSYQSGPRRNERIRVPEIRVVGPEGAMIGVMPTKKALDLAKSVGLDLVEVSPNSRPPVCRILDFGKYMYEQSKKQKESKSTSQKLKEVKFRVKIDTHDYMTKIRRAEDFLDKGNKLKLTLMFRGREMEHTNLGFETVKRAIKDLESMATADNEPRLAGRNISVTLSPLPSSRRKKKFGDEPVE